MRRAAPLERGKPLTRKNPTPRAQKPLRRQSAAQRRSQAELVKLLPALRARSGDRCEARFSPNCLGYGTGPHHKLKRSAFPKRHRLDELMWVCPPCNGEIEDRPDEAYAAGLTIKPWEAAA